MRLVFCGSSEFAVPTLRRLCASGQDLAGVFTQPPRPAGRGGKLRETEIDRVCGELGLRAVRTSDINGVEALAALREMRPDVTVVADFGQFIHAPARAVARRDTINLHASLLPLLRGAAPINWALLEGHEITGVSTFSLVDAMDAGDVYFQRARAIPADWTAEELRDALAADGADLVVETLEAIGSGVRPLGQDHDAATRAPLLKKSDGRVDFAASAAACRNRIHGTWPWPGARAVLHRRQGKPLQVTFARAAAKDEEPDEAGLPPGTLDASLRVATGSGRLEVLQLKPAGKRTMDWRDFVNGYRVQPADRFEGMRT
jgi:methionyl-tRNA formyltransferase